MEVNENKDNVEIVSWHYIDSRGIELKRKQALKEGGRILTLESAAGNTQENLSLNNKDNAGNLNNQINREKNEEISGLENYTEEEIKNEAIYYVNQKLDEAGLDAEIVDLAIIGSRKRGDAKATSDLDIVLEFDGDISEDGMFNLLNDGSFSINGINVDINPITADKTGTLEEYLAKARKYDEKVSRERQTVSIAEVAIRVAEENRRKELRTELDSLSKEFNTPVVIHENTDTVSDAAKAQINKTRTSGWYEGGKVHIYLPHATSKADIQQTFFHETVAHKGLRDLLGEQFNDVMQDFFRRLPKEVQQILFDDYRSHPVFAKHKDNEIRVIAAEEFIAKVAERGEFQGTDKRNVLQRLIDAIRDFFQKNNFKVQLADVEKLANDYLRQSAERLQSTKPIYNASQSISDYANRVNNWNKERSGKQEGYYNISDNELQNLSDREIEQIEAHNERIINQVFDKVESLPIEKQYPKLVEELKKQGAPDNVIDKIDNNEESDLFINTQQALIDKIGIDAYEKLEKEYDKRRKQKNLQDLKKQLTVSHVLKQPSGHIKFGDAVYGFNYLGFWLNKNNTKYDLIVNSKIKNGQAYNPYATEKHSSLSKKEVERIMHSEAEAYVKYGFNYLPLSEISRKLNEKRENGVLFRTHEAAYNKELKELKQKAITDGTFMKAPNGNTTNLTEQQWLQVRTPEFKKWFGDWEKAARIEKLKNSKSIEIKFNGEYALNRYDAKKWAKDNIRGEYVNRDTDEKISISRVGINEVSSHGSRDKAHLISFKAIPDFIENSIFIDELPNLKNNDKYDSYRYYALGAKIDGEDYTVKVVICIKGDSKYYDHRLTRIEKGTLIDSLNGLSNSVAENKNTSFRYKDKRLFSLLQINSSKVVDENGEPLVVYHGTNAEFNTFKSTKFKTAGYFSKNKSFADKFSKVRNTNPRVKDVFLNITNPLNLNHIDGQKEYTPKELKELIPILKGKDIKWRIDRIQGWLGQDDVIDVINSSGYTGVVFNEPNFDYSIVDAEGNYKKLDDELSYIAFESNQIKSATDNVGTFDAGNDDIRFRSERQILPDKIKINGVERTTINSNGEPIADTEDGIRKFYDWFGDSKIVDQDRRPLVVYHGTTWDPYKESPGNAYFSSKYTGTGSGDNGFFGNGFYFTHFSPEAKMYGSKVIHAYLSLTNPFDYTKEMGSIKGFETSDLGSGNPAEAYNAGRKLNNAYKEAKVKVINNEGDISEISLSEFADLFDKALKEVEFEYEVNDRNRHAYNTYYVRADKKRIKEDDGFEWDSYGYEIEWAGVPNDNLKGDYLFDYLQKVGIDGVKIFELPDFRVENQKNLTSELKRQGYDGVIAGDELIAYDANQIKSATDNVGTFDAENDDIRFRAERELKRNQKIEKENARFNQELDEFKAKRHRGLLHLGTPFEKLRAAGIIADELTLSPTVLNRKLKQHDLTTDDLKGLSKAIQDPILVYKHGLNIPNIIVITELDVKGGKLSISVVLDSDGNVLNVNNVSSVHSKDAATELTRLEDYSENELKNALGWVEKEKVLDWLSTAPLYGGMHTNNPKLNSITNIIQNFENPSIGEENIPLFRTIGKIGASRMDGAEMVLADLAVAKKMESTEKDAKTIRLATGWERGADGKWRYEVADERVDGRQLYNKPFATLGRIMPDSELLKQYPELGDVGVRFEKLPLNNLGSYRTEKFGKDGNPRKVIVLNESYLDDIKSVGIKDRELEIADYKQRLKKGYTDAQREAAKLFGAELWSEETLREKISEHEAAIEKAYEDLSDAVHSTLVHEVQHAIQEIEGFARGGDIKIFGKSKYNYLAGEVEARNVQARMDMTPEQRRKTLLADTEDVAREEQVVLYRALSDEKTEGMRIFAKQYDDAKSEDERYKAALELAEALNNYYGKEYNDYPYVVVEDNVGLKSSVETVLGRTLTEDEYFEIRHCQGIYFNDKIYLVSGSIDTSTDFENTWFHENVHREISSNFDAAYLENIYDEIETSNPGLIEQTLADNYHSLNKSGKIEELISQSAEYLYNKGLRHLDLSKFSAGSSGINSINFNGAIATVFNNITNKEYGRKEDNNERTVQDDIRTSSNVSSERNRSGTDKEISTAKEIRRKILSSDRLDNGSNQQTLSEYSRSAGLEGRSGGAENQSNTGREMPLFRTGMSVADYARDVAAWNEEMRRGGDLETGRGVESSEEMRIFAKRYDDAKTGSERYQAALELAEALNDYYGKEYDDYPYVVVEDVKDLEKITGTPVSESDRVIIENARGFYWNNKAYLISNNNKTSNEFINTWEHENAHREIERNYDDNYLANLYDTLNTDDEGVVERFLPEEYHSETKADKINELLVRSLDYIKSKGTDLTGYTQKTYDTIHNLSEIKSIDFTGALVTLYNNIYNNPTNESKDNQAGRAYENRRKNYVEFSGSNSGTARTDIRTNQNQANETKRSRSKGAEGIARSGDGADIRFRTEGYDKEFKDIKEGAVADGEGAGIRFRDKYYEINVRNFKAQIAIATSKYDALKERRSAGKISKAAFEDKEGVLIATIARLKKTLADYELQHAEDTADPAPVWNGQKPIGEWAQEKAEWNVRESLRRGMEETANEQRGIAEGIGKAEADTDRLEFLRIELDERLGGWFGRLAEGWQDNIRSVRIFFDMMKEQGLRISDFNNFYMQYTAIQGKNDAHLKDFGARFMKPVNKMVNQILGKTKYSYRDIENYVMAKHGIERNNYMKEEAEQVAADKGTKARIRDDYSGLYAIAAELYAAEKGISFDPKKKGEVEKIQALPSFKVQRNRVIGEFIQEFEDTVNSLELETKHAPSVQKGMSHIDAFWKTINAATHYSLDRLVQGGVESKKEIDDLKSRFKYYVPLRGHEIEAEKRWQYEAPDNKNVVSKAIVQAKGRSTRAEYPFAYMIQTAQTSINKANRNMLNQTMLRLARMDKTGMMSVSEGWYMLSGIDPITGKEIWTETEPEFVEDHAIRVEEISAWNEKMVELEAEGKAKRFRKGLDIGGLFIKPKQRKQHAISVYEDGVLYQVYINGNPRVAQAVNELSMEPEKIPWISPLTRFVSSMVTSRSPQFMLTNGARDFVFASTILPVKEGAKYMGQFLKSYPKAMALLANDVTFKFGKEETKMKRYLKEFKLNGGETGYSHLLELHDIQKKLEREQRGKNYYNPLTYGQMIIDVIDTSNSVIENATRLATYIASRENGRSIERSVSDSKEVTLNFNRRGTGAMGAACVKPLWMFVNAGVQALANVYNVGKMNPVKMGATIAFYSGIGYLMPMLIKLIGGDDAEEEYWNLTDWERQNNFCFYTGDGFGKIPLPQEFRVFHKIGDLTFQLMSGKTDVAEATMESIKAVADLIPVSPLGTIAGGEVKNIGDVMRVVMIDAFASPMEVATNTTFMGTRVYDGYKQQNKNIPGYQRARLNRVGEPRAPKPVYGFAKWLDYMTGGDGVKRGVVSMNPDIANHLIRGYFGGIYNLLAEGEKSFSKRFYTPMKDLEERSSNYVRGYYDKVKESDEILRQAKAYKEQVRRGEIGVADFAKKVSEEDVMNARRVRSYKNKINKLEREIKSGELDDEHLQRMKHFSDSLKQEVVGF